MTNPADYHNVVVQSTLLNAYQKQALLDGSDELPGGFKQDMITFLTGFDKRSAARDAEYTTKLKELIAGYRAKIAGLSASDEERVKRLEEVDVIEKTLGES